MTAEITDNPSAADHGQRFFPLCIVEIVGKKHDIAHVIEMRMRNENIINTQLLFKRQHRGHGPGIDKDIVFNEETGGIEMRKL
jgi:hypothetical protein